MSWIEKLYQAYENNTDKIGNPNNRVPLLPLFHTTKKRAHVEVVLDGEGKFLRASVIPEDNSKTILPATEGSAGRTSGCAPHPLADQLQYVAADYVRFGGDKGHYYDSLLVKFKGNEKLFNALLTNGEKDKHGCLRRILVQNIGCFNTQETVDVKKRIFSKKIDADIRNRETDQVYYKLIDSQLTLLRKPDNKLTEKQRERKRYHIDMMGRIKKAGELSTREKNYLKAEILEYIYSSIEEGHIGYFEVLEGWAKSDFTNLKVKAVYKYISEGNLINDLVEKKVLHVDDKNGKLLKAWKGKRDEKPDIFKALGQGQHQTDTFIRWSVDILGDPSTELQYDKTVWQSWIDYYLSTRSKETFCYVSGESSLESPKFQPEQYPRMIRSDNDGAKLISSNDTSGFTFRGRFIDEYQVCGVDVVVAQKAHSALRWLIGRQGKVFFVKNEPKLAVVAWAVSGLEIPDPLADSNDLLGNSLTESEDTITGDKLIGFTAQDFGVRLSKYLSGYHVKLGNTDEIIVMGIDSATPGRMAITYYRELTSSDFLKRIKAWHEGSAWLQRFSKDKLFYGAPAPRDIAQAAYGTKDDDLVKVDDNLQKTTVERLIPCIIDGAPLPWDIVNSCIKKATQRQSLPDWAWQKTLGITCGLYQYYFKEKEDYTMGLDRERRTRAYLYGRLLAAADCLERFALFTSEKKRDTNAARLMQRFSDRPCSTWKTIELSLFPYKARLGGRSKKYQDVIDETMCLFESAEEFNLDKPLSGEFLLGYHCQREALKPKKSEAQSIEDDNSDGE